MVSATMVSCGTVTKTVNTSNQPSLENTKWQLADHVKGKIPTLTVEGGKLNGNAGCNNYFGEINLDANTGSFSAKNIGSTKMICDNMATETNFLGMVPKANKYRVAGSSLELYQDNLLLLKFNKMQ